MPALGRSQRASGEAPGRLDLMGGVADYSGSLVLETPTRRTTRVVVEALSTPRFELESSRLGMVSIDASQLENVFAADASYRRIRERLDALELPRWPRYPLGCLIALARARPISRTRGYAFHIDSDVPLAQGVSSSAALEVATLRALVALHGVELRATQLARLAQEAENQVVGAPCGLMDQLTSHCGELGALLPILCRPDELWPLLRLPGGVAVAGWPSGVERSVGGSPYLAARTATFMGKKLLEVRTGRRWQYAAEISPDTLRREGPKHLPPSMRGAEFLAEFGPPDDELSQVDPERVYGVRDALGFPVEENRRCVAAAELLGAPAPDSLERVLTRVGELMAESHRGYSSIGLGSPATDEMVAALMQLGPAAGIYGARSSAGGSGGTVAVLLREAALPALERLAGEIFTPDAGPQELIL